ncbi:hypothetical protein JWZ98_18385 [Methylomonas sp. EFPC1]|nr:hypothetical protein [Methylomonas sp. EFPC1]QSB00608.1 hypothetical protein JWZ98_18385 [Methylomonas sp. EFPC1]
MSHKLWLRHELGHTSNRDLGADWVKGGVVKLLPPMAESVGGWRRGRR